MRKSNYLMLCAVSLLLALFVQGFVSTTASASASAEIAMELTTGTVLEEANADRKLPMASTTKIMTAIIVIEDCDLDEEFVVPDEAVGVEGSSIYLKKDETINVRDLLYGLMLRSGNDSAAALAIHHSGSVDKFVEEMNVRALKMGAENTNFKNPSGLPDSEHYTTARDLCEIARYAMHNPTFKEIVSTKNYTGKFRSYANKNKMLYNYEGANGVKTGYTLAAGRCLVSSAERNGMDVICVVLNCPDMYERSKGILDQSFNGYNLLKIDENRVFMCDIVPCKLANTSYLVVKNGAKINFVITPCDKSECGDCVAYLEIYSGNDLLLKEKLYNI